jgi:hypothetical protein
LAPRGLEFLFTPGTGCIAESRDAEQSGPNPIRAEAARDYARREDAALGVGLVSGVVLAAACTDAEQRSPSRDDETDSPRSVTRGLAFAVALAQLPAASG